jgi:hypothetical protein
VLTAAINGFHPAPDYSKFVEQHGKLPFITFICGLVWRNVPRCEPVTGSSSLLLEFWTSSATTAPDPIYNMNIIWQSLVRTGAKGAKDA